jgi:AcrR family transcriptional regulator
VLDVAARLFSEHGYRGTSLELVAGQLDVTRQALYYHFMSKDEILAALYEELMTKLEMSAAAVVTETADDRSSRFTELVDAHLETTLENADLVAVLMHDRPALSRLAWLHAAERREQPARPHRLHPAIPGPAR